MIDDEGTWLVTGWNNVMDLCGCSSCKQGENILTRLLIHEILPNPYTYFGSQKSLFPQYTTELMAFQLQFIHALYKEMILIFKAQKGIRHCGTDQSDSSHLTNRDLNQTLSFAM